MNWLVRIRRGAAWGLYCIAIAAGCSHAPAKPPAAASTDRASATVRRAAIDDWSNWRGADSRSIVAGQGLPDPWPAGPREPSWSAKLGVGWSSPVVADGRVFITDRVDKFERVLAFDAATGKPLWKEQHPVDFEPHAVGTRHGNGPKATPLVRDGKIYSLGIAGWLECRSAVDGAIVWQVSFPKQFGASQPLPEGRSFVNGTESVIVPIGPGQGAPVPLFGYTGSPVAAGDLLISSVGGERGGTIVAFDLRTGRVVWKSLEENVSYSSPIVATVDGVQQVVVMTGPRVVGLELVTGKLLWSRPFQIQYDESISTPSVAGDLVLVTGDGKPLTALRVTRAGTEWHAEVAWTNEILSSYLSSMVAEGDYVYGMNDGGELSCVRLSDGQTQWTGGSHGYYCSPVIAGSRLFCLNERGNLLVAAAEATAFRQLGAVQLVQRADTWTMPAIVGGRIFVRSGEGLACFDFHLK